MSKFVEFGLITTLHLNKPFENRQKMPEFVYTGPDENTPLRLNGV